MPGLIRSNSAEVSQRRPMASFTVRTGGAPFFEVAVATSPDLFRPENRQKRNAQNFWSSRAGGPLAAERGEAVYVLPTDVLGRFAGKERLFFAVATFADAGRANPDVRLPAPEVAPFLLISKTFTGKPLRSLVGVGARPSPGGYGSAAGPNPSLEWAGDSARPGGQPVAPSAPIASAPSAAPAPAASAPGAPQQNGAAAPSHAAALGYDDGFDPHLWARPLENDSPGSADGDDADRYGVDGPVPDDDGMTVSSANAYVGALSGPAPEYPGASRFEPAAPGNFTAMSGARTITRIVIHVTDGGRNINGTISWFKNPDAKVSAHYVVGQDGEVVQMVRHADKAWHAHTANRDSIGIEHVASRGRGIFPTDDEYRASAALVRWLCGQFGLPTDRDHIVGHNEADRGTTHAGCPTSAWDWDRYMAFVNPPATSGSGTSGSGAGSSTSQGLGYYGGNGNGNGNGHYAAQRVQVPSIVGPVARGLSVVQNAYNPTNVLDALRTQLDFQRRFQQWSAGVGDTSFFPHSAICQLQISFPGGTGIGTGFYIARDRILTAAHCVVDWSSGQVQATSIKVIPGRNGAGTAPFGSFTVQPSDWAYHPRYDGTRSFDLAVIRTSTPPPGGAFFNVLEELNQSLPSSVIVTGYAAVTVNQDLQHMDGDQVRSLADGGETLQYNLQTEGGTSGSPVYYVWGREDDAMQASVVETRVIGVHVSGFSGTLNQGCRLTDAKIAWIRAALTPGAAASYGLGYQAPPSRIPARMLGGAVDINWDDVDLVGQPNRMACWATSGAMVVGWRDQQCIEPAEIARRAGLTDAFNNLVGLYPNQMAAFAQSLGLEVEPPQSYTVDAFADLIARKGPLFVSATTPMYHVFVVTGITTDGNPDGSGTSVRIADPWGRQPGSAGNPGNYNPDAGNGARYLLTWADYVRMYEARVTEDGGTVNVQIVHARGTGGRTPASGSRFSYSYGLAAQALEEIPLDPGVGGRSIPESSLRAGDIIVSTTGAFISDAIRAVSGAAVSHAGIYTGSGTIIEAIRNGVVERPIADSLRDDTLAVAFRKPGLTDAQAQAAVEFALAQVGRPYNYWGIVRQAAYRYHSSYCNLLPASLQDRCRGAVARVDLGTSDGSTFFCSQLVIAAFQAAGAPLTTTDPQWTDPGQLAELRLNGTLDYVGHLKAPPLASGSALAYAAGAAGRYARLLSVSSFSEGEVDALRGAFQANAQGGSQQNCITIVNSALRAMYGQRLRNDNGSARALGDRINRSMGQLQGYGLAGSEQVFEFLNAQGTLTKGVVRPDHLRDSVEAWMNAQAEANQQSAWYLFGLSIMDGYHSVVLGLSFLGTGNPSTHVFWADQIYSGWDDVTGGLDARITTLTQRWWDRSPADRRPRTRVTLWPLQP